MQADHGDCDPDDVVLDFAVAAGYPGGAGIIQHVRLSLTELAVKNLAGKPKGTLTLSSKTADALPAWLTPDYLLGSTGLIQRVDIGSAYPQTLRDHLLTDSRDARNREQLFCRELKVRLPMQALEFKVRRQYGLTTTGYRYVKALMGEDPAHRWVEGQEIVLRPLGLCRKPHAAPDPVENFFIIEPRQANIGPHLLYRPLYPDCLYEYSSRQALLEAIATPGALHDSVLTWLTDKARPVYANGGIKEPHILQFLSGDDATRYDPPAPATLALDEGAAQWLQSQLNGQLLNHLFGSTARALVDLADRESVSNHESRWAILMEGAWLLFNTLLLPLLRGPAMLAGWLMILVSSLEQDLAGLDSTDATTRELALIDLLLNMAMVLLHATAPSNPRPAALDERAPDDLAARLDAWRRPASAPHPIEPVRVSQGSVALPGEPPLTGQTALDFSRSIASPKAAENLLAALLEVNVPWPERLPAAEASGPCKGLYRIGDHWHASLGGLLFQVAVVPGFGEVYLVHPQHPLRPGFKLTSDGQGHWRLDRGARLEGGMPRDRRTAWRLNHAERVQGLSAQLQALGEQFVQGDRDAAPIVIALNVASARLKQQKKPSAKSGYYSARPFQSCAKRSANVIRRNNKRPPWPGPNSILPTPTIDKPRRTFCPRCNGIRTRPKNCWPSTRRTRVTNAKPISRAATSINTGARSIISSYIDSLTVSKPSGAKATPNSMIEPTPSCRQVSQTLIRSSCCCGKNSSRCSNSCMGWRRKWKASCAKPTPRCVKACCKTRRSLQSSPRLPSNKAC